MRENKVIRFQDALVDKNIEEKVYTNISFTLERYTKKNYKNYVIESYCKDSTINMFLKMAFI